MSVSNICPLYCKRFKSGMTCIAWLSVWRVWWCYPRDRDTSRQTAVTMMVFQLTSSNRLAWINSNQADTSDDSLPNIQPSNQPTIHPSIPSIHRAEEREKIHRIKKIGLSLVIFFPSCPFNYLSLTQKKKLFDLTFIIVIYWLQSCIVINECIQKKSEKISSHG